MTRRTKRFSIAGGILAVLLVLYTLGGFFGVPWITQAYVLPGLSGYLNGEIRAGDVTCNPFTLRLELDDIAIVDRDDKPVVTVDKLVANAGLASVWRLELYLQQLTLDRPHVNVIIKPDGESNIEDLVEPAVELWAIILRSPRVTLDLADVNDASADFTDLTLDPQFHHKVSDLDFHLTDFSTRPDQHNPYSFTASTGDGESIAWKGSLTFNPLSSHGEFTITGIDLPRYFPYARRYLNSTLVSGHFTAAGSYDFSPVAQPQAVDVKLASIVVSDVALKPAAGGDNFVTLSKLEITDVLADLLNRKIAVGGITIDQTSATAERSPAGKIDLISRLTPNWSPPGSAAGSAPGNGAADKTSGGKTSGAVAQQGELLPPHLREAQEKLRNALNGLIAAAQSPWRIDVGPLKWNSLDVVATDRFVATPIAYTVGHFTLATEPTGSEQNFVTPFKASLTLNERTAVQLAGKLDPLGEKVDVEVKVDKLAIAPAGQYLQSIVDANLAGDLSLTGPATLALLADGGMQLTYRGDVTLEDLQISKNGEPTPRIAVRTIALDDVALDLAARRATVASLAIREPKLAVGLDRQGRPDLIELMRNPDYTAAVASVAMENHKALADAGLNIPFDLRVDKLSVENGEAKITDRTLEPHGVLSLSKLNAALTDIATKPAPGSNAPPTSVDVKLVVDDAGGVSVAGDVRLLEQTAKLKLNVNDLDLAPANPYLRRYSNAQVAGKLHVSGPIDAAVLPAGGAQLTLTQGDIVLTDLTVHPVGDPQPRLTVQQLDLDNVDFNLQQRTANVAVVNITKPDLVAGLNADGRPDLFDLLSDAASKTEHEASASENATSPASASVPPPFNAHIGEVALRSGTVRVTDRRYEPAFATNITELNAQLRDVSTEPSQVTQVKLDGRIAAAAPFTLEGSLTPLSPMQDTQVKLDVAGFPMPTVSTFTQRFLAHPVSSGRAKVGLDATVKNEKLVGTLDATLSDFYLGDKSAPPHPDALKLPVKLGLDLLRDDQKRIVIAKLPLSGDLSQPNVDATRVVMQAVTNLLTGVISAPFKFIGSTFGGHASQDLAYIAFVPGEAKILPDEVGKLDIITKALKHRPALTLGVVGHAVHADVPVLRRQEAMLLIRESAAARQSETKGVPVSQETIAVSDAMYQRWIREQFEDMFPPALEPGETLEQAEQADPREPAPTFEQMEQAVLSAISVRPLLTSALADDRAAAVHDYLIDEEHIDASRVHVTPPTQAEREADHHKVLEGEAADTPEAERTPRAAFVLE